MRIAIFDTHKFERDTLEAANKKYSFDLVFFDMRLTSLTAPAAKGFDVVCSFVNDDLKKDTLEQLSANGVRLIALRSAGFNHVDLTTAKTLNIPVVRVPEYSPYAVAEHALALMMTLNRKIHRAYNRVRDLNFNLDGLVGFDMHGKTVGVIGTGKIGRVMVGILRGLGCDVLAHDPYPDKNLERDNLVRYVDRETIYQNSDIITLHCPLTVQTRHMIDSGAIAMMKPHVLLINTGRGALIETQALVRSLKERKIGGAGLDVYEEEEGVFFQDLSGQGISDDILARLLTFPNVVITSHQAFLTHEALENIAATTLQNIAHFAKGEKLRNEVKVD